LLPSAAKTCPMKLSSGSSTGPSAREQVMHNLSDADFVLTGPAVSVAEIVLRTLAPELGYDPTATAAYNNGFRNPALTLMSAERLFLLYSNGGLASVRGELGRLRAHGIL
jgi:hypothetical protein